MDIPNDPTITEADVEAMMSMSDEFAAGIGKVAIWFSLLEDSVSAVIRSLLQLDAAMGEIVTAELSFRAKIALMASLAKQRQAAGWFEKVPDFDSFLNEIFRCCTQAEEHRNKILHSTWTGDFLHGSKVQRRKVTAKASHGLKIQEEHVDSKYLVDAAIAISRAGRIVDNFWLTISVPDAEAERGQA